MFFIVQVEYGRGDPRKFAYKTLKEAISVAEGLKDKSSDCVITVYSKSSNYFYHSSKK